MAVGATDAELRFKAQLDDEVSPKIERLEKRLRQMGATPAEIKMMLKAYDDITPKLDEVQRQMDKMPKEQVVALKAETAGVSDQLAGVRRAAEEPIRLSFTDNLKETMDSLFSMRTRFNLGGSGGFGISPMIYGLGNMALGGGVGAAAFGAMQQGVQVNQQMEQSMVTLTQTLRDSAQAKSEMQELIGFAQKTPFAYQDVLQGDVRLRSYQIPTMPGEGGPNNQGWLGPAGDMAAAMGTPLTQAVEAIADARQGYFVRMMSYGIRMMREDFQKGGKYAGLSYEQGLERALKRFDGSMEMQSKTFTGLMSNIQDIIQQQFYQPVGQEPFGILSNVASAAYEKLNDPATLREIGDLMQEIQRRQQSLWTLVQRGADLFRAHMQEPLENIIKNLITIGKNFTSAFGGTSLEIIQSVASALGAISSAITGVISGVPGLVQLYGVMKALSLLGFGGISAPFFNLLKAINPLTFSFTLLGKSIMQLPGMFMKLGIALLIKNFIDAREASAAFNRQFDKLSNMSLEKLNTDVELLALKLGVSATEMKNLATYAGEAMRTPGVREGQLSQGALYAAEQSKYFQGRYGVDPNSSIQMVADELKARGGHPSEQNLESLFRTASRTAASLEALGLSAEDAQRYLSVFGKSADNAGFRGFGAMDEIAAAQLGIGALTDKQVQLYKNPDTMMKAILGVQGVPAVTDVQTLRQRGGSIWDYFDMDSTSKASPFVRGGAPRTAIEKAYRSLQSTPGERASIDEVYQANEDAKGKAQAMVNRVAPSVDLPRIINPWLDEGIGGGLGSLGPGSGAGAVDQMNAITREWMAADQELQSLTGHLEKQQQVITDLTNKQVVYQQAQDLVNRDLQVYQHRITIANRAVEDLSLAMQQWQLENIRPLERQMNRLGNESAIMSNKMTVAQREMQKYSTGLLEGEQAALDQTHALELYNKQLQLLQLSYTAIGTELGKTTYERGFSSRVEPLSGLSMQMQMEKLQRRQQIEQLQYETTYGEQHYQMQQAARSQFEKQELPYEERMKHIKSTREEMDKLTNAQFRLGQEQFDLGQKMFKANEELADQQDNLTRLQLGVQAMQQSGNYRALQDEQYKLGMKLGDVNRELELQNMNLTQWQNIMDDLKSRKETLGEIFADAMGGKGDNNFERMKNMLRMARDLGTITKTQFRDAMAELRKGRENRVDDLMGDPRSSIKRWFDSFVQGFKGLFTGQTWNALGQWIKTSLMDTIGEGVGATAGEIIKTAVVAGGTGLSLLTGYRMAAGTGQYAALSGIGRLADRFKMGAQPVYHATQAASQWMGARNIPLAETLQKFGEKYFAKGGPLGNVIREIRGPFSKTIKEAFDIPSAIQRTLAGGPLRALGTALTGPLTGPLLGNLGAQQLAERTTLRQWFRAAGGAFGIARHPVEAAKGWAGAGAAAAEDAVGGAAGAVRSQAQAVSQAARARLYGPDGRFWKPPAALLESGSRFVSAGEDVIDIAKTPLIGGKAGEFLKGAAPMADEAMQATRSLGPIGSFFSKLAPVFNVVKPIASAASKALGAVGIIITAVQGIADMFDIVSGGGDKGDFARTGGMVAGGAIGFALGGPLGAAIGAGLGQVVGDILSKIDFGALWDSIKEAVSNALKYFTSGQFAYDVGWILGRSIKLFIDALKGIGKGAFNGVKAIVNGIISGGKALVNAAINFVKDIIDFISDPGKAVDEANKQIMIWVTDIKNFLVNGIKSIFEWVINAIPNIINWAGDQLGSLWDGFKDGLGLAGGIERVPQDGYQTTLHKDEAVLQAGEANVWRALKSRGIGGIPPTAMSGSTERTGGTNLSSGATLRVTATADPQLEQALRGIETVWRDHSDRVKIISKDGARSLETISRDSNGSVEDLVDRGLFRVEELHRKYGKRTTQKEEDIHDRQERKSDHHQKRMADSADKGMKKTHKVVGGWTDKINSDLDSTIGKVDDLGSSFGGLGSGLGGGSGGGGPLGALKEAIASNKQRIQAGKDLDKEIVDMNLSEIKKMLAEAYLIPKSQRTAEVKQIIRQLKAGKQEAEYDKHFSLQEKVGAGMLDTEFTPRNQRIIDDMSQGQVKDLLRDLRSLPKKYSNELTDAIISALRDRRLETHSRPYKDYSHVFLEDGVNKGRWKKLGFKSRKEAETFDYNPQAAADLAAQREYINEEEKDKEHKRRMRKQDREDKELLIQTQKTFAKTLNNFTKQWRDTAESDQNTHQESMLSIIKKGLADSNSASDKGWKDIDATTRGWLKAIAKAIDGIDQDLGLTDRGNGRSGGSGRGRPHPDHAHGGLVEGDKYDGRGQLIRVGEEGFPEVVIPLAPHRRDRAKNLMRQAKAHIGSHYDDYANGGIIQEKHPGQDLAYHTAKEAYSKASAFAKGGVTSGGDMHDFSGPHGSLAGMTPVANLAASKFGLQVTAGRTDHGYTTSSGNVSDHSWGGALDLSNGTSPTPQMDAWWNFLHSKLGKVYKQIIYKHMGSNTGPSDWPYPGTDHFNHVHTAMLEQYASNAPLMAQILANAMKGISIKSLMRGGVSGGDILASVHIPTKQLDALDKLGPLGKRMKQAYLKKGKQWQKHLDQNMFSGGINNIGKVSGSVIAQIGKILLANGLNKIGAAGIIGNALQESGWDPGSVGSGGGGLWGFTAGEISLASLQAYAKNKGVPWDTAPIQTYFMLEHLSDEIKSALNAASSPAEAAEIFMTQWERPAAATANLARRQEGAMQAYKMGYRNGGFVMPAYAGGVGRVPSTGPAMLHEGETVLPQGLADLFRAMTKAHTKPNFGNFEELTGKQSKLQDYLEDLKKHLKKAQKHLENAEDKDDKTKWKEKIADLNKDIKDAMKDKGKLGERAEEAMKHRIQKGDASGGEDTLAGVTSQKEKYRGMRKAAVRKVRSSRKFKHEKKQADRARDRIDKLKKGGVTNKEKRRIRQLRKELDDPQQMVEKARDRAYDKYIKQAQKKGIAPDLVEEVTGHDMTKKELRKYEKGLNQKAKKDDSKGGSHEERVEALLNEIAGHGKDTKENTKKAADNRPMVNVGVEAKGAKAVVKHNNPPKRRK